MKSAEEIIAELKKFSGSCILYKHWLNIRYTEGIKHLAETTESFWLIDAIASHQTQQLLSNPYLEELQIWRLVVQEKSGILICEWDIDERQWAVGNRQLQQLDKDLNQRCSRDAQDDCTHSVLLPTANCLMPYPKGDKEVLRQDISYT